MASSARDVLALDPGEKVGWARASVQPDGTWENLEHGIAHLKDMALAMAERINGYDVVVVEEWRLRANKARQFTGSEFRPVQFIGMARLLCWQHPHIKLVMQSPAIKSTADKTAPDWLREIIDNEPATHDDAHNVDALRHLWLWTWENHIVNE